MSFFALLGSLVAAYGGPVAVGVLVAQSVSRAIPQSKGGFLGAVRKVTAVIGAYKATDVHTNIDALAAQGLVAPRADKA